MRTRTKVAIASLAISMAAGAGAAPVAAANERMELQCTEGSLAGSTFERTNGSSWWDVQSGAVYTTKSIIVSDDAGIVHAKEYGNRTGHVPATCSGAHFEFTWDLELVRVGK